MRLPADVWEDILAISGPLQFGIETVRGFHAPTASVRRIQARWRARWTVRTGGTVRLVSRGGDGTVRGFVEEIGQDEEWAERDVVRVRSGAHMRWVQRRQDSRYSIHFN